MITGVTTNEYRIIQGRCASEEIGNELDVLSLNMLGFYEVQAHNEGRPYWKEELPDGSTRGEKVCDLINQLAPKVFGIEETHDGDDLNGFLAEKTGDNFYRAYADVLPQPGDRAQNTKLGDKFSAGLFVGTRYRNTSFEAFEFETKGGIDRQYLRKGFGVLSIRNDQDELIARIAFSHFQSGGATKLQEVADGEELTSAQIRDLQGRQVIAKLRELNGVERARFSLLAGDLNVDRKNEADYRPNGPTSLSILDPDSGEVIDGFYRGVGERAESQLAPTDDTQVDIGEEPEAVDNIVAIRKEKDGEAGCTLVTKGVSSYEDFNDPSDHMALLAEVRLS